MKVKLADNYTKEWLNTQDGFNIKRGEIKEFKEDSFEAQQYLRQGFLIIIEENNGKDEEQIIKSDIPKDTIKEVVNEENKEKIKEVIESKKEDKESVATPTNKSIGGKINGS